MAVIKKGDKYYVVIEEGRDPVTKKRKQKWYSGFDRHQDAVGEEERIKTEMRQGTFIKPTKITLSEYLDSWLESLNVRRSTLESYKWAVEYYLKPSMGHIELNKILPEHIDQHFVNQRKAMEKAEKEAKIIAAEVAITGEKVKLPKSLSPTSIHYQFVVLNAALRKATRMRKIPYNPCDAIEPPKKKKYKPDILDISQIKILLTNAIQTNIFIPVIIGITCGLRRGEICGLMWSDLDFKKKKLQIYRSLDWEDGILTPGPPKSDRSERPVPLLKLAITVLQTEKARQDQLIKDVGDLYKDQGYVWAWDDGRPHSPDYLYKRFKQLLQSSGLPDIRVHDLRHSYATLLRDQGVDMETISEMLGHYSSSFTHGTYAHQTKSAHKKVTKALDALFDKTR
ncbi:MAG: site-specific integrase [Negativicutes bacterium]|nr:site-specific integrase [Negativicutes bacterium]